MKTIGLVGGLSWHSTIDYYRYLNQGVHAQLGGHHQAKIVMVSVDLHEIVNARSRDERLEIFTRAVNDLVAAKADFVMFGANTPHLLADDIRARCKVPLLHIVEALGAVIKARGLRKVGIVGTKVTLEATFYRDTLARFGIELVLPNSAETKRLDDIIREELMLGEAKPATVAEIEQIMQRLRDAGAEGVVMGCTEIPPLIDERKLGYPCFDTTRIHAAAAVTMALG